jgi:hypothetical protein
LSHSRHTGHWPLFRLPVLHDSHTVGPNASVPVCQCYMIVIQSVPNASVPVCQCYMIVIQSVPNVSVPVCQCNMIVIQSVPNASVPVCAARIAEGKKEDSYAALDKTSH